MMALVVLDEEVPIANRGENDLGHPAVEGFLLVPEFVASIQRQPVDDPQGESESHYLPPRDRLRRDPPCTADQRSIVHRNGKPSENSIIAVRSEEHTSELQSLMRISYAVFCLKKKNKKHNNIYNNTVAK